MTFEKNYWISEPNRVLHFIERKKKLHRHKLNYILINSFTLAFAGAVFVFPPDAPFPERSRSESVTYVNIPVCPTSKKQLNYMELELQEPGPGTRGSVAQLPAQSKDATEIKLSLKQQWSGIRTLCFTLYRQQTAEQGGNLHLWRFHKSHFISMFNSRTHKLMTSILKVQLLI